MKLTIPIHFIVTILLCFFQLNKVECKTRNVIVKLKSAKTNRGHKYCGVQKYEDEYFYDKHYSQCYNLTDSLNYQSCHTLFALKREKIQALNLFLNENCPLPIIDRRIASNFTKVILIGAQYFSDEYAVDDSERTFVYLPLKDSAKIKTLLKDDKFRIKILQVDFYDHAYLILTSIAFFSIFFGCIWVKYEYEKKIFKLAAQKEKEYNDMKIVQQQRNRIATIDKTVNELNKNNDDNNNKETAIPMEDIGKNEIAIRQQDLNSKAFLPSFVREKLNAQKLALLREKTNEQIQSLKDSHFTKRLEAMAMDIRITSTYLLYIVWFSLAMLALYFSFEFYVNLFNVFLALLTTYTIYCFFCIFFEVFFYPRVKSPYSSQVPNSLKFASFLVSCVMPTIWIFYPIELSILPMEEIFTTFVCIFWVSRSIIPTFYHVTIISMGTVVYIFMLNYILPSFTSGISITDAVINGGFDNVQNKAIIEFKDYGCVKKIPGLIYVPYLSSSRVLCSSIRNEKYAHMAFIDIIIPGYIIVYALIHDISSKNRFLPYFSLNILTYPVALLITYVMYAAMNISDSTILFVAPSLVSINVLISILNQDFFDFWTGQKIKEYVTSMSDKLAKKLTGQSVDDEAIETPQIVED